jgi:16S rRNA (adenine1518-N6/adenine1519-N6)-dimethyltransferase
LLSPADVRRLAADLGLRPSKRRGQNFLVDPNTVRRLVRLADVGPADAVLEIGPGLGSLTLGLLGRATGPGRAGRVTAVEVDPLLAAALPGTVAARLGPEAASRLTVVEADALHLTAADLTGGTGGGTGDSGDSGDAVGVVAPGVLAANLPYNVAVPLLLGLLERLPSLRRGLVMVQAEVADRLTAPPGSRVYGAPSVKLAWYAHARPAGRVPRPVFWPEPNVDSGLVAFTRHDRDPGADSGPAAGAESRLRRPPHLRTDVFAAVDAAFAQRRKTLRTALAAWAGSPTAVDRLATRAGVDPGARGETLDVDAFVRLAAARRATAEDPE